MSTRMERVTIREFAAKYNLRLRTDKQDDTLVIQGQIGHIYEHSPSELGLLIIPPGTFRPRLYAAIRKKCLSVGIVSLLDCDGEGTLSIRPRGQTSGSDGNQGGPSPPQKKDFRGSQGETA